MIQTESRYFDQPILPGARPRRVTAARVIAAFALAAWGISMPALAAAPSNPFGLLFAAGPGLAIATALAIIAFAWAVSRGSITDVVLAILVYITVVRLPVVVLTDVPIYSWTYKHLGVIDYIADNGVVANGVDIYSGWPGFFAAVAWFTSISGIAPVDFAHWFSFGYHLALAAAVYGLARAFGQSTRVALIAVFIVEAFNWVGQDYLSPQALAFLFAVVVLTLLLRSREHPSAGWFAIALFAAITVTHQLTPYWLIGIAVVLGVTGHIRPRYVGVIFIGIAVAHLLVNLEALSGHVLFSGVDPVNNAQAQKLGESSAGHTLSLLSDRLVSAFLWAATGLTILVSVVRNRRITSTVWVATVLAFSSFMLLAGQNYGGEAVFRVFLYSLPGCALILAPVLAGLLNGSFRRLTAALVIVLVTGMLSLEAYYGAFYANLVQRADYDASVQLYTESPAPMTFLVPALGGAGRSTGDYVRFAQSQDTWEYALSEYENWQGSDLSTTRELNDLTGTLRGSGIPAAIIVTDQMKDFSQYNGIYPDGALDNLVENLRKSADWTPVTDTASVHMFTLNEEQ